MVMPEFFVENMMSLFIFIVLFMVYLVQIIGERARSRALNERLKKLEANMSVLTNSALGMGQKILNLESRIGEVKSLQEDMKTADTTFSFTQAEKLISEGLDDQTIAANSGLSASEINLMRMLHSSQSGRHHVAA